MIDVLFPARNFHQIFPVLDQIAGSDTFLVACLTSLGLQALSTVCLKTVRIPPWMAMVVCNREWENDSPIDLSSSNYHGHINGTNSYWIYVTNRYDGCRFSSSNWICVTMLGMKIPTYRVIISWLHPWKTLGLGGPNFERTP